VLSPVLSPVLTPVLSVLSSDPMRLITLSFKHVKFCPLVVSFVRQIPHVHTADWRLVTRKLATRQIILSR